MRASYQAFALPRRVYWLCLAAVLTLSACGTPPRPPAPTMANTSWSGRMGLQVHDPMAQEQSFSASFHLQGSPEQGQLDVFNPFGSQIAQLQWTQGHAMLRQGERIQHSNSLQDLLRLSLGTELPLQALFSWLRGLPMDADGWHADLTRYAQGRITAQRMSPPPQTTLRVVLQAPQ